MLKLGLGSTLDLNVSVNGGQADSGVAYEALGGKFTVNASGVVTPVSAGVGVVVVKETATNKVIRKIAIAVMEAAEVVNFQSFQSTSPAVITNGGGSGGGSSVSFVDQEIATFDANGNYTLASAPNGISSGSIAMLTFDGLVQDGVTASKRFSIINDASGVKRKIQLYSYETVSNFTKVNTPTISQISGYNGLAVLGGNSFLTVTDSSLALGTGDFTVEAWIYAPNWNGYNVILGPYGGAASTSIAFGMGQFDGMYAYSDGWVVNHGTSSALMKFNEWVHVAWVRSGTTVKTYINGQNAGTGASSQNYTNTVWGIGAQSTGADPFRGYIRNVRVTKAARYTSNFTPFAVSSDVTQISDNFASNTVLKASLDSVSGSNITWSVGTSLLPNSGVKCLVSYRVDS
jgi:hypothetical protein